MKKQTRSLLIIVAAIIILLGVAQYLLPGQTSLKLPNFQSRNAFNLDDVTTSPAQQAKSDLAQAAKEESVSIDLGNGQKLAGQTSTQSAYQALVKVAKENNLTVEAKQYEYGVLVTKVGDIANTPSSAWGYWVNGKSGQIASDRYIIYPGDKVEWKFAKF